MGNAGSLGTDALRCARGERKSGEGLTNQALHWKFGYLVNVWFYKDAHYLSDFVKLYPSAFSDAVCVGTLVSPLLAFDERTYTLTLVLTAPTPSIDMK